MIPGQVMAECREKARNAMEVSSPRQSRWRSTYLIAGIVFAIGCLLAAVVGLLTISLVILLVIKLADK